MRLSFAVAAALLAPAPLAAAGRPNGGGSSYGGAADGVLAYPAEEGRLSSTCFTTDDEFRCGWYCAQAFYVQTFADDTVELMPFGEGNLVDEALCSDCTLFEGSGVVEGGSLVAPGAVAFGELKGGYKWTAQYDADHDDVFVNFTDWLEPCEIHYLVTEGDVMGVPPAPGRPLRADASAVVQSTGEWSGWPSMCEDPLPGCELWQVDVFADVADWQNLDEVRQPALACPARVNVWSTVNDEYTGHDGVPRGSDFGAEGNQIVATRNVVDLTNGNNTRCAEYFDVVQGCLEGLGPACGGGGGGMEAVRAHVQEVRSRRAAKQQPGRDLGLQRRPAARPRGVSEAVWEAAMHAGEFDGPQARPQPSVMIWASLLAFSVAVAVAACTRARRGEDSEHKIAQETHPLLAEGARV